MKFLKITPLRRYRIFRNFSWPASLPEFARYNVIYGWNGSGKTTLSSAYRALERRQDLASSECEFFFDGGSIRGNQLSSDRPRPAVRVFNRAYVEETVFRSGRPGVPSIFYVAEGSKDKQGRIDEITVQLNGADGKSGLLAKMSVALGNESRANKAFDDFQIAQAAAIKAELRSSDTSRFDNYNKSDFKAGIGCRSRNACQDQAVCPYLLPRRGGRRRHGCNHACRGPRCFAGNPGSGQSGGSGTLR